jgi:hypothetical protein
MHAEQADNSEMNDLSGHLIGCETIRRKGARQKTSCSAGISFGKLRIAIKRVSHGI